MRAIESGLGPLLAIGLLAGTAVAGAGADDQATTDPRAETVSGTMAEADCNTTDGPDTIDIEMSGSGAHEGLFAVYEVVTDPMAGTWDLRGVIIEGELPPLPEPVIDA